ncbi:MAG TPA: SIMPL domain-containing protein [Nitrososphaera sp.]|nr:SIMPL domain-containing protein [Nitrososphaera sp.]
MSLETNIVLLINPIRYHMMYMAKIKEDTNIPSPKIRKKPDFFLVCMLILTLLMAMPFPGNHMPSSVQAQTSEENSTEAQEPAAGINATQSLTGENETTLDDGNLGQQDDDSSANLSTLSITSTSTAEVRPDRLSVTVGVETNGTTAQEAASKNSNITALVIGALRGLGINEDRIGTSSYTVSPVYEYIQPPQPCIEIYPPPPGCETKQQIIGYRAANTVTATLDVPSLRMASQSVPDINAGQVIDATVAAGANRVESVTFFISSDRQEEIRGTLIGEAITNARQRAGFAAEALGTTITGVASATINPVDFPVFTVGLREAAAAGASDSVSAPTQILPGQQEVSTTVNVIYYIGAEGSTNP